MTKGAGYSSSGRGGRVLKTPDKPLIEEVVSLRSRLASDMAKRASFESRAAKLPVDKAKAAMARFDKNLDNLRGQLGPRVKELTKRGLYPKNPKDVKPPKITPKPVPVEKNLVLTAKPKQAQVRSVAAAVKLAKSGNSDTEGTVLTAKEGSMSVRIFVDYSGPKPKLKGRFDEGDSANEFHYKKGKTWDSYGEIHFDAKGNIDHFSKRGKNSRGEITDFRRDMLDHKDLSGNLSRFIDKQAAKAKVKAPSVKNGHFLAKMKGDNKDPKVAMQLLKELARKQNPRENAQDTKHIRVNLSAWEGKKIFGRSGFGNKRLDINTITGGIGSSVSLMSGDHGGREGPNLKDAVGSKGKIVWGHIS